MCSDAVQISKREQFICLLQPEHLQINASNRNQVTAKAFHISKEKQKAGKEVEVEVENLWCLGVCLLCISSPKHA
jgi:hypothetical protein